MRFSGTRMWCEWCARSGARLPTVDWTGGGLAGREEKEEEEEEEERRPYCEREKRRKSPFCRKIERVACRTVIDREEGGRGGGGNEEGQISRWEEGRWRWATFGPQRSKVREERIISALRSPKSGKCNKCLLLEEFLVDIKAPPWYTTYYVVVGTSSLHQAQKKTY